jgi:hypothetical protein
MGCAFLYAEEWEEKSISPSVSFADSSLVRGSRCGRRITVPILLAESYHLRSALFEAVEFVRA